jgi:hypothetical protein
MKNNFACRILNLGGGGGRGGRKISKQKNVKTAKQLWKKTLG